MQCLVCKVCQVWWMSFTPKLMATRDSQTDTYEGRHGGYYLLCIQYIPRNMHAVVSWRRHQMEAFSALLAICAGNSPVPGEFPTQRPVTRSCDVFFDLRLDKRLSKRSWGWWFETPSHPLWRQCNVVWSYIDGLAQNCSKSSALAMELQQLCTKPSIYSLRYAHRCMMMTSWDETLSTSLTFLDESTCYLWFHLRKGQ